MFAENGISNVSLVMIAKTLGASRGKIYHHFPTGKGEIIDEILQIFEDCIIGSIPDNKAWESEDVDIEKMLSGMFFTFRACDMQRLRKISRIIMAEMYHNEQIAQHSAVKLIAGRGKMLADWFTALAANGKIPPLDAESTARCLNRLIVVYEIEDATRYFFEQDSDELDAQTARMIRDCTNIIRRMITNK